MPLPFHTVFDPHGSPARLAPPVVHAPLGQDFRGYAGCAQRRIGGVTGLQADQPRRGFVSGDVQHVVFEQLDQTHREVDAVVEAAKQLLTRVDPLFGALPLDEAVLLVMQLSEAVAETHSHGIVIRELSPAHVHVALRPGGAPVAKITDFGTAKLLRDSQAPTGNSSFTATAMFGLSPYSSPEMVRKAKNVDGRADVWSLGAILYHLLTGQAPFAGDIATLMLAITRDEPTPASTLRRGLPQELDQVLAWSLAKDVDRRFRDVNAFAHALGPYGGPEAQVLAERIAGIFAASRGQKDPSRAASTRA